MARRSLNLRRLVLLTGITLAALPFALGAVVNPDLWWHLSAGRFMVEHGALPRADFLSWTRLGLAWLDFEWLSQLIFYAAHSAFGVAAFVATRALCYGGALWMVLRMLRRRAVGEAAQGLAALMFGAALLPLMDARPDNSSILLFAVVLDCLDQLRLQKRVYKPVHLAYCAAFFALWANLHPGFAYGLLLIGLFALGDAIEPLWSARLPSWKRGTRLREYSALLAAGFAGTLLNPYGPKLYTALEEHARDLGLLERIISEWRPPDMTNHWQWPYALLLALSACAVFAAIARGRRAHFGVLLSAGYFAWASTQHQRHIPYFAVAAVPALFEALESLRLSEKERRIARVAGLAVFGFILVHSVFFVWPTFPLVAGTRWQSEWGGSLADYLESEPGLAGHRLYHSWGYGGYLGWRLAPRYPVFYDGRYLFHPLYDESQTAFESAASWTKFLDKNGVDSAALGRRDIPQIAGRPYYVSYMPPADWALVAWNDHDVVFVRRSGFDKDWVAAHEYKTILPDDEVRIAEDAAAHKLDLKRFDAEAARHAAQPGTKPREAAYFADLRRRLDALR
jgi:hypothetical protein